MVDKKQQPISVKKIGSAIEKVIATGGYKGAEEKEPNPQLHYTNNMEDS